MLFVVRALDRAYNKPFVVACFAWFSMQVLQRSSRERCFCVHCLRLRERWFLSMVMKHLVLVFALFTAACTTTSRTGVFVNGQELTASDKSQLDALVGEPVPAGRYAIDASGNLGYAAQPFEMHSNDSHIVSEGGCTILSTPSGSLSSGC